MRHIEYFHDDIRAGRRFFDGILEPKNGMLAPDYTRPGTGLRLRRGEIREHLVYSSGTAADY